MKTLPSCWGIVVLLVVVSGALMVSSVPESPLWAAGDHEHGSVHEETAETDAEEPTQVQRPDTNPDTAGSSGRTGGNKTSSLWSMDRWMPGLTGAPNIHPMLVHFPIAFLVGSTVFLCLSWFVAPDRLFLVGRWLFWSALVVLPVVVASGFWAVGGWGDGHVTSHRNWMLLTTVIAYVVFGLARLASDRSRLYRLVLTVGLILTTGVMAVGADRGAWLVYVEGAGVQPVEHDHDH